MFRIPKLIFFLLFVGQTNAQILENHFYGNTEGTDLLPEHLIALEDGGAVITGKTNTLDTGGYHVLLIRTDSLGNVLWQRTYHQGVGSWVCKALDGGFVVGGSSDRHLFGSQKGFVLKVNESGVEEWKQYLPFGDHSYVSNLEQLSSGDIAVCGVVVEEGANASQKIFWSIFSGGGGLIKYETTDNLEKSFAPKIVEGKNGNLILAWSSIGPDWIRCFTPSSQTVWEHNLTQEFDYEFKQLSLLVDSLGDVWVAGGYKENFNGGIPQVLQFSSIGSLNHTISHESLSLDPPALFKSKDGAVNYWIPATITSSLIKLKLSSQGTILSKDYIFIDNTRRTKSIAEVGEDRALLLQATPFQKNDIWVQPIRKFGSVYEPLALWKFSSGLPYAHDFYESHCKSLSGGEFILTRGEGKSSDLLQLGYYILRIGEDNLELARTYIGDGVSSRGGQIQPMTDGGAVALGSNGLAWKVDANAKLVWSKQTKSGKLLAGPNNDFFIAESKFQPSIYDPIRLYHFNNQGDSVSVTYVSSQQPFSLDGAVSQVGNGPILFANKYDDSDKHWHNWLIYLDKEGEIVSEVLLDSTYFYDSFTNKIIQTSDGGIVIASHLYSPQGIYLMHVKDDEVLWSTSVFGSDQDSIYINLVSIEEVPCKGYVLAFESNLIQTNTPSKKLMLLYYIDENGQGKDFYTYNPLLGLVNPDTGFLPGYTFRRWDYQMNEQTYDILLQTVHFEDTSHVAIPQGQLAIMPNPSGGEICLHYESTTYGVLDIEIFNAAGQRVDRFKSEKTSSDWQLHYRAHYPAGTYFVQIKNGEKERVVQRWVKER